MTEGPIIVRPTWAYRAALLYGSLCFGVASGLLLVLETDSVTRIGGGVVFGVAALLMLRPVLDQTPWLAADEHGIRLERMRLGLIQWSSVTSIFIKRRDAIFCVCFELRDSREHFAKLGPLWRRVLAWRALVSHNAVGAPVGFRRKTAQAVLERIRQVADERVVAHQRHRPD